LIMWVVRRRHDEVAGLAPDERAGPRPDRTVVVPAMAEYIGFTGKQIGMPTIRFDGRREYLRDGVQLLEALRLAGRTDEVFCLWMVEPTTAAPSGCELFGPEWEDRTGSGARLVRFELPLDAAQVDLLSAGWGIPPRRVSEVSWGWGEAESASLPDWLTWMRGMAKLLSLVPPILAVNGRRPVFPPPG
jgi:hypothetical protein